MGRRVEHVGTTRRRATRRERLAWFRFGAAIAAALGIAFVTFGASPVVESVDADHHTTITCHVREAAGEIHSTHSRGITRTTPRVVVSTRDCGELVMRAGVTRSNMDRIAARFDPPGTYRIEVGAASWELRHLLPVLRRHPAVFGFQPAR